MTEPWFDPIHHAWIPGTIFGGAAGIMGALVGWLVPQGKARRPIVRSWIALWILSWAMLVAGIVALETGQPYGIWYGLLLPGVIGTVVLGGNLVVILKRYREVEERRLAAKDLL
ncbi:conserved membrane hypothetical protein [Candidatus Sulfopaludibacter sp. SbA3]|nr:conserved membrane hypothetical protein [Candidatus Sulfopaludibacter sp. SbA3]